MTDQTTKRMALRRLTLALIGALAGVGLWWLVDREKSMSGHPRAYLFLFATTAAFFWGFLAMVGPLSLGRAARGALLVALPSAGLLTWASLRFDGIVNFLVAAYPLAAFGILILIPLPFLIALQRGDEGGRNYQALFNHSWAIVVRMVAAWLFVGIFWGVVLLSDALLNIIGLTVIGDFLKINAIPYILTGLLAGLAIAVVNELREYVSPYLILRLLRLFIPPVLAVMAVFVAVLPLRGMSGLFQGFSAAAVLLAMALVAITLVSVALDQRDEDVVRSRAMRVMVQMLALLLPVVAALAGYSIWERVAQYGWTPKRLAGASAAGVVLMYALAYAVAVLGRGAWMARIRRSNINMAVMVIVFAVLWLTPVFNPQRIATASQITRFIDGRTPVKTLDLWTLKHAWGRAGQAGITQLSVLARAPGLAPLRQRLKKLALAKNVYGFRQAEERSSTTLGLVEDTLRQLAVRPTGHGRAREVLENLSGPVLEAVRRGCALKTRGGNPGCVLLFADLSPRFQGDEAIVFYMLRSGVIVRVALTDSGAGYQSAFTVAFQPNTARTTPRANSEIDDIVSGAFALEPSGAQVLRLKDGILSISR